MSKSYQRQWSHKGSIIRLRDSKYQVETNYNKRRERLHKNMPWPPGLEEFRVEVGCPIDRLARILGTTPPVTLLDLTGLMYEGGKHPFYMIHCYTMRRDPPRQRREEFMELRSKLPKI